ncbi:MAG: UDP-glucose dehydrogenase family protein [bacterium]
MTAEYGSLTVGVIGLGHVGLPTALGLAEAGWHVLGADDDQARAGRLARGAAPFYEPGLGELLGRKLANGHFRVMARPADAVAESDVLFVCVSTPPREDGAIDLTHVKQVAELIGQHANGYKVVVEKSTTPVRTADLIIQTVQQLSVHRMDVVVNPEFLREGRAVHDVLHPDRIILGVESDRARATMERLYRPILDRLPASGECAECERIGRRHAAGERLLITDRTTAELIKHTANALLATRISFINMIADFCEVTGADVTQVARGIGLDPRIGPHFLHAGIGYGGSCLPKDLRSFIRIAEAQGVDVSLLRAVAEINERRIERFVDKLRQTLGVLSGKTIAVWGLAFKPGTDDVRDAPSLKVISRLLAEGATVRVHDPQAMDNARQLLPKDSRRVEYCASPYEAATGAHAVLLLTEWEEYRALDWARLRNVMDSPVLVDGRNLLDPTAVRAAGFEYIGIGRP